MLNVIDNYFHSVPEPEQSCLLFVRSFILNFSKNITEEWKFNTPFYYYNNKWLCYIPYSKKKKEIYIGFVKGYLLKHKKLLAEGRKQIKIYYLDANNDIDINELQGILKKACALYETKTK